jgi:hypothetical protein
MEKFNFTTKLHLACSNDELRPIMNCVHFAGGFAYATNGNLVVKQSLEYHSILDAQNLDGKSLHRENYKNIMQFEVARANQDGIECSNADGRKAFFEYFDMKGEKMPNFDAVITKDQAKQVGFIGLSPELMKIVMEAMYLPDGYARVSFYGIDRPMLLDAPGVDNQIGVVMPVLVEPTLF